MDVASRAFTLKNLHNDAMEASTLARHAKWKGQDSTDLRELAYKLEAEAAAMLKDRHDCEPTRGVLYRSAAWLAIDAGHAAEARELAEEGLRGENLAEWLRAELVEALEATEGEPRQ